MHPVIEKVREIAAQNPDYVYQRPSFTSCCCYCSSHSDPNQGCLIGRAILAVRPDLREDLLEIDKKAEAFNSFHLLEKIHKELDLTKQEVTWLNAVQFFQDTGITWSMAVAEADRVFPLEEKGS